MAQKRVKWLATVAQVGTFTDLIDARSPSEYADDHLPGARSFPVLFDAQRERIGTLYKQVSPFEAKKLGAAWVAKNVAAHIEQHFIDQPRAWRPLVYCWRGGQRSGAFTHILREIGWDAHRLDGGYKAWRRQVLDDLAALPAQFDFRVISGATGSAKSRVLEALAAQGAQVLHLEALAAHKGSVLGALPGTPQPGQRLFESRLHQALQKLDPALPVFAEAESRRIGALTLPEALILRLRAAPCFAIEASLPARIEFILRDYAYLITQPEWLIAKTNHLRPLVGHAEIERWQALINAGEFRTLVGELLRQHYDPLYQRSQGKNYAAHAHAKRYATDDLSPIGIEQLARAMAVDALAA